MMPTIFVLDVPEFRPFVDHALSLEGCSVQGPRLGYWRLARAGSLEFTRKAMGLKPAVWHGALTAGMVGRITHFDNDRLVVEES
ncbi:hypothetical protein [Ottowia sp.]|uniref:hypothetical protein n=1 Tax=Ottowia sp. TaxID=1898956 RepID=UPI003C7732A1